MNHRMRQPDRLSAETTPPDEAAARASRFAAVRLSGLLLLGCFILLGTAGIIWYFSCLSLAGRYPVENRMEAEQADALIRRGDELLDQAGETWPVLLRSGRATLAEYLLRLFISPRYLAGNADDRQFIEDLHFVLAGEKLQQAELDREAAALLETAGRLHYINEVLTKEGYPGRLAVEAEPTRLLTLIPPADLPRAGQEVVGRLPVTVQARLTGSAAVFRLFAGKQMVDEVIAVAADPLGEQTSHLNWHTDWTGSGTHQLSLLVLSSDGRGRWLDIASLRVPEGREITAGSVSNQETAGWYRIASWPDGSVRLNILNAREKLAAELYSIDNQLLAETVCAPGQPGALLARPVIEGPYYVRLGVVRDHEIETGAAVTYTLVCAPAAARDPDQPDDWLAVLDLSEHAIKVRDVHGQERSYQPEQLALLNPEARLSALSLRLPDGTHASLTPVFDAWTERYVLYVAEEISQVVLNFTAMEGSAAEVTVALTDPVQEEQLDTAAAVPLARALNHLTLKVHGFSGIERAYHLYILRPPDAAGLSAMLEPFPRDYRLPLLLLHIDYPAYRFEAQRTGIDWQTFLDAQDTLDRSLIDANHVPASWVRPDSPVYDGVSWKAAARPVIAYYGDPRNFLDPVNVFQFEKLSYLPALHARAGVEQILRGTFMEVGRSDIDYTGLILEAGQDADISPFFLAARIIQEMGNQGQSPLASGTLAGYEGVYNFYNIGATPNPDVPDGARINGARYALYGRNPDQGEITPEEEAWLLPWTSPRRAIVGGARWIAQRYVAIGQDTLYGQKFDLIEADGLFMRQYAQNIQMAWAEGRRTRQAWQDLGLIQEAFVFRIPVFEQMPAQPAVLP